MVRKESEVLIIFLTASDEEMNIIMGLDIGAERVSNEIKINMLQTQVYKNGEQIELTVGEYKLLCLFMQNPNIVLTKNQILQSQRSRHF